MLQGKAINEGSWYKVQIVDITVGFSQHYENGKWVNCTELPEAHEREILTLGKYFNTWGDAEKFIETKSFKSLLKATEKLNF